MNPNIDEWIDKHCTDADVFVLVSNAESTLMDHCMLLVANILLIKSVMIGEKLLSSCQSEIIKTPTFSF